MKKEIPMYSIGYQGITAADLERILTEKGVTHLLDVRSKPHSRWKPEFNKPALEGRFANSSITYIWEGKTLGGLSEISEVAIKRLAAFDKGLTVCIMCMEKDSEKCTAQPRSACEYQPTASKLII